MRSCLLLLCILFIISCSDKRECECGDDMEFSWKDRIIQDNIDVQIPNAVLNVGVPLSFTINTIINNQEPPFIVIEWNLQSAKLYKGNQVFLDNANLNNYVKNKSTIEFPHELFFSSIEGFESGPVFIEMSITFPESGTVLFIDGTIYFYTREDIVDDFYWADCRWASQVIGEYFDPC